MTDKDLSRFLSKVRRVDGCWVWTAYCSPDGYGCFGIGSRTDGTRAIVRAHRLSYEHFVGPIPAGFEVDHLCKNPSCVNPSHLEAVTRYENMARSGAWPSFVNRVIAPKRNQTHCVHGHEFTPENTIMVRKGKYVTRRCRECGRIKDRAYNHGRGRAVAA